MRHATPTCTSSRGWGSDELRGEGGCSLLAANHSHDESDPRRVGHRMSGDLSQLTERQLYALRGRLARGVHDPALSLRGALHSDLRQCSNERCRCRHGEPHGPYTYLSVYGEGRSRTLYVPQALAGVVSEHVEATRRGEALLLEISQVNLELLRRRALR
jgi:Family of unknown function (DUF6788)